MDLLGISCYFHGAAAALLRDGQLFAAAEEERFSRKKHDYGFPQHAIDFCLKTGGIPGAALDYVVFFEKPFVKFERLLLSCLQTFPRSRRLCRLTPMVLVLLLLAGLIIFAQGSAIAPFIYTLF
jgi:carbamoyltransferase